MKAVFLAFEAAHFLGAMPNFWRFCEVSYAG